MTTRLRRLALATAALAAGAASPALAIDIPGTALSLSGEASVMTDYRFRGISLSNGHPSAFAALTLSHENGVYAGAYGQSVDIYDDDPDAGFRDGSDLETGYYGGWSGDLVPGLTIDASLTYYAYPGVTGATDFAEALVSAEVGIGPVSAKAGAAYFPDQKGTADSGTYAFAEVSAEVPLVATLTAHVGRQAFGAGYGPGADYWEWQLGASRSFGPFEAGLSYVDTNLPHGMRAGATVVASLGVSF